MICKLVKNVKHTLYLNFSSQSSVFLLSIFQWWQLVVVRVLLISTLFRHLPAPISRNGRAGKFQRKSNFALRQTIYNLVRASIFADGGYVLHVWCRRGYVWSVQLTAVSGRRGLGGRTAGDGGILGVNLSLDQDAYKASSWGKNGKRNAAYCAQSAHIIYICNRYGYSFQNKQNTI